MPRPLTDEDLEYIEQAKDAVNSMMIVAFAAKNIRNNESYTFLLEAARGYAAEAFVWMNKARYLHHWEMDLVRAAVAGAHYAFNLFVQHCNYAIPMNDDVVLEVYQTEEVK